MNQLPPDATLALAYLLGRLERPRERVEVILALMHACAASHGDAFLRIGVQGFGHRPNWRVEYGPTTTPPMVYGNCGYRWLGGVLPGTLQDGTWSTARMSLAEVELLLAQIIHDETTLRAA